MAISVVQIIEFMAPAAGATSIAIAFSKPPVAGNSIIVLLQGGNGSSNETHSVSDTESNSYTEVVEALASDGGVGRIMASVFAAHNISVSGGVDVTVAFNSATSWFCGAIMEVSGLAASPNDQTGTATGTTTGDAAVTASGANAQADMLVCAVTAWTGTNTNVAYTGPTTGYQPVAFWEDSTNITAGHCAFKIVSASETSSATWTHSNTGQTMWAASIATFKAAAAATVTFFGGTDDSAALAQRMRAHEMVGY